MGLRTRAVLQDGTLRRIGDGGLPEEKEPWNGQIESRIVVDSYEFHARRVGVSRRANEMTAATKLKDLD